MQLDRPEAGQHSLGASWNDTVHVARTPISWQAGEVMERVKRRTTMTWQELAQDNLDMSTSEPEFLAGVRTTWGKKHFREGTKVVLRSGSGSGSSRRSQ